MTISYWWLAECDNFQLSRNCWPLPQIKNWLNIFTIWNGSKIICYNGALHQYLNWCHCLILIVRLFSVIRNCHIPSQLQYSCLFGIQGWTQLRQQWLIVSLKTVNIMTFCLQFLFQCFNGDTVHLSFVFSDYASLSFFCEVGMKFLNNDRSKYRSRSLKHYTLSRLNGRKNKLIMQIENNIVDLDWKS